MSTPMGKDDTMNDALTARAKNDLFKKRLGYAILICSPFLLLLILSLILGENALDAHPVWLDELCYWRTLYSWDEMGFATGYYGMHEQAAAIGTMGIDGIGPILMYGWFVKLFGLSHNTIMLANAVWCAAAAAIFCAMRKPRLHVSLLLSGMMMGYAPIVLYTLTSMTQCFHYALVLLYITFLLGYQEKRKIWMLIACVCVIVLGALCRPMYCLLFLPLWLLFCRYRFSWKMFLFALPALAISLVCCYIAVQTAAPSAQGFIYHLLRAPDASTFVQMLLSHTKANLYDFFVRLNLSPMQNAFRYLYCGVTVLCLIASFVRTQLINRKWTLQLGYRGPMMSCFLLLLAAFSFTMMLYEANDWADFRRLAPYLWLVIAYMIARHRFTIPTATLAACALTLCMLIARSEGVFVEENRFISPEAAESLPEIVSVIEYDTTADDPYRNTIRIDVSGYRLMEELHPGMGLQYGWFTTETTGKSRWILTDKLKCPVTGYENVLDTGDYKLYKQIESTKED